MKRTAFVALTLAFAACWGCGGKTTTVTGPDGEKVTVSHKGDKIEGTVIGPDGEKVTYSAGGSGVELPEGFPKDVPLYPGATVAVSHKEGKSMGTLLKTDDDMQQVRSFYESKLKENGWTIESSVNMGEGTMFACKKDTRTVTAVITAGQVHLTVQNE